MLLLLHTLYVSLLHRLIDLESAVVTSVCTGVRGHEDGLSDECGIVYPHSLLLTPDNDILVGEVGGYIRRLEG